MRILLVLNKANRETTIMNAVKREISIIAPASQVKLVQYDHKFLDEVLSFRPNVIMTFPMTSVGLAAPYYIFKQFFNAKVVCFRAEGIIDQNSPDSIANHVGYDSYGPGLVDYELFWGPGPAGIIGDALLARRKLSSPGRIKYFGYPRLERYFGIESPEGAASLDQSADHKLSQFGRDKTILLATGFHFANYTREMIFAAKDLDAENRCDELLGIIEEVKRFRTSWIDAIRLTAKENPDLLFVVKKHPIEKVPDYGMLDGIGNVLYVWQDIDIGDLIMRSALFFHYGSTSLVDAYLTGVPAVYVRSVEKRCANWFPDLGWPSARSIESALIGATVSDFRAGRIVHETTSAMQSVLEFNFNIRGGQSYRPSREIAELLLSEDLPQRISIFDSYLRVAMSRYYYQKIRRVLTRPIKKVLRTAMHYFQ